jgi:hypothetical protein
MESTTRARTQASESSYSAAQAARETLRVEQASAAGSNDDRDRVGGGTSAAAVEVDSTPPPASVEGHGLVGDRTQPPREVARLEDVLTIEPRGGTDNTTAAAAVVPVDEVELLTRTHDREADWARLLREVARLEAALTEVQPSPEADSASVVINPAPTEETELPTVVDGHVSAPKNVPDHLLREAFWFEQASAFKSDRDRESVAPPPPKPDTQAVPQQHCAPAVVSLETGPTSPRPWMTRACLLALIGLVALLLGRSLRRSV